MIHIDASDVLATFSQVANEHTKTMKLQLLEQSVNHRSIKFLLNLYTGDVLRPPTTTFNKVSTTDVFKEIVAYFSGNMEIVSMATIKIIRYVTSNSLGVSRGDTYALLIENQAVCNVYQYLTTAADTDSCKICGAGTISGNICDYCYNQIEEFTKFRSKKYFKTKLTEANYGRVSLLQPGTLQIQLPSYNVLYNSGVLTFTRLDKMQQEELPFKEYQKTLIH